MPDAPALEIRHLRFAYPTTGSGKTMVVDIDSSRTGAALRLDRGEQILLTGGSGTGKSTLLHLISGLMDPTEGEVFVNGQNVHSLTGSKRDIFRGRYIGMVFQTFNLLHGFTALENVMAALMFSQLPKGQHAEHARKLLDHLGIHDVNRNVDILSVGQQQRVAVSRAVACNPVLVLADEPTASLDPENAAASIELIRTVCREKNAALLCVSHDPLMSSHFERRVALADLCTGAKTPVGGSK